MFRDQHGPPAHPRMHGTVRALPPPRGRPRERHPLHRPDGQGGARLGRRGGQGARAAHQGRQGGGGAVSIATRKGDKGTTGLLHGQRVPKDHPQIEALGAFDELNVEVGAARLVLRDRAGRELLRGASRASLVALMGEVACAEEDAGRHARSRFARLGDGDLRRLDESLAALESKGLKTGRLGHAGRQPDGRSRSTAPASQPGGPSAASPPFPRRAGACVPCCPCGPTGCRTSSGCLRGGPSPGPGRRGRAHRPAGRAPRGLEFPLSPRQCPGVCHLQSSPSSSQPDGACSRSTCPRSAISRP